MTGISELEKRIRRVEDYAAIQNLKAKYWRCIDKKLWDEMAECFTEDAATDYGPVGKFRGVDAIIGHMKDSMGGESVVTAHQGHNTEIEVTGDKTAIGQWEVLFYRVDTEENRRIKRAGWYVDDFVKVNGAWKIKRIKFGYFFRETWEGTAP